MEDPTLPRVIITIDPETYEYHVDFENVPYELLVVTLEDFMNKVHNKELPFDRD